MAAKRPCDQDPDYEDISTELQESRQEEEMRKLTKLKIEALLKKQFLQEIQNKDSELEKLDEILCESRNILDRLRACIVTKYYATSPERQAHFRNHSFIHPAVIKHLGKKPKLQIGTAIEVKTINNSEVLNGSFSNLEQLLSEQVNLDAIDTAVSDELQHYEKKANEQLSVPWVRVKYELVVGNVSKFIPLSKRIENDQLTHIWKAYVREGSGCPKISDCIQKICFLLHPSFRPNDIIEVSSPPFELTKRGWGDFPLRVQIYFQDSCNKPVDIIHNLKLDKTYTGLTTVGPETHAEIQIYVKEDQAVQFKSSEEEGPCDNSSGQNFSALPENCKKSPLCTDENSYGVKKICSPFLKIKSSPHETSKNQVATKLENINSVSNGDSPVNVLPELQENTPINSLSQDQKKPLTNCAENVKKKLLPKFNSSNSLTSAFSSLPSKPFCHMLNGMTPLIKCTDSHGRTLLVPQSSLVRLKPSNSQESSASAQEFHSSVAQKFYSSVSTGNNVSVPQVKQQMSQVPKPNLPLYVLKVVSSQQDGSSQVLLLSASDEKSERTSEVQQYSRKNYISSVNGFAVPGSNIRLALARTEKLKLKTKHRTNWLKSIQHLNISACQDFECLLKKVIDAFPLVSQYSDRSVLPFCASSPEMFSSWNIGKRKAAEWQRAGLVRSTILSILQKKPNEYVNEGNVWSRKQIMRWCRRYGYTPECTGNAISQSVHIWPDEVKDTSHSDLNEFMSGLENCSRFVESPSDEEIEIERDNDVNENHSTSMGHHTSVCLPYISDAAAFVKDTASQISISLLPTGLEPGITVPCIEEMILSACKVFATDILRSAINQGYKRVGGKTCPAEVTLLDVYLSIREEKEFQFLTNKHMGVPKEYVANS